MKPWIVYTRVSTNRQVDTGGSLEAQLAAVQALAKAHGYTTIHVEDAGESAKDVGQPGLMRVKAMAARGEIAGVLVYKLDRIARNTRGLLDLLEGFAAQGVQFASVREHIDTGGAHGRLIITILAALAQFEREQLAERIKASNDHRRTEGAWVAGAPPIGFVIEKRGKLRYLVPHPKHAPAVAECWAMILDGAPLAKVAAHLEASKVTTSRKGARKPWTRNSVSGMLKNRVAIGPLVSAEDFDKVQALLAARSSPRTRGHDTVQRPSSRVWRLHGLARCPACGSGLVGTVVTTRGKPYPYLRCSGRVQRGKAFCNAADLPATPWEDAVVGRLSRFLADRANLDRAMAARVAKLQAEAGPLREQVDALRQRRDGIREKLDRALELSLQGGATARAVGPMLGKLQAEIEVVDTELGTAEGRLAYADGSAESLGATIDILAASARNLPDRDWERQRDVLQALVIDVVLGRGEKGFLRVRLPGAAAAARMAGGDSVRRQPSERFTTPDRLQTEALPVPLGVYTSVGPRGLGIVSLADA